MKILNEYYKNNKKFLELVCLNDHRLSRRIDFYKRNSKCPICTKEEKEMELINIYKNVIESYKMKLVNYYHNEDRKYLEIKCINNHIFTKTFNNFSNNPTCSYCQKEEKRLKKIKEIYNFAKKKQIIINENLFETYDNNQQKISLTCPKGHKYCCTWNKLNSKHLVNLGCDKCSFSRKKEIYEVDKLFYECGYVPHFIFYENSAAPLSYKCKIHEFEIQKVTYSTLKRRGSSCKYCFIERIEKENSILWQGGKSDISDFLRKKIKDWKTNSMKQCDYRCVITGDKFDAIHHLYSFNQIVKEVFSKICLDFKGNLENYSQKELDQIILTFNEIHDKYPLGVCLRKDVHEDFHSIYGNENNTPQQFEAFKKEKIKDGDNVENSNY